VIIINKKSINLLLIILAAAFLFSCTKEIPKEMQNKQMSDNRQMPNDSIHRNLMPKTQQNGNDESADKKGDEKADQMTKEADDADAQYQKTKSDSDKKITVEKQMAAANYLMFEANLSPKKKYRPALKRYRRVLELDPSNKDAKENKQQIEDIYKSMGMEIPE
jgi:tetratricopeptide (TPR) repeat protein